MIERQLCLGVGAGRLVDLVQDHHLKGLYADRKGCPARNCKDGS